MKRTFVDDLDDALGDLNRSTNRLRINDLARCYNLTPLGV